MVYVSALKEKIAARQWRAAVLAMPTTYELTTKKIGLLDKVNQTYHGDGEEK